MVKRLFKLLLTNAAALLLAQCSSTTAPAPKSSGWLTRNAGLPETLTVTAITNVPETQTLYIGTHNGIYKSVNNGESWSEINKGLETNDISCIAARANIVYAGSWGKGVYRSLNGGEEWQSVWSSDKNPHVNDIFVSPSHQTVYVATEHGLFKSENGGETWAHIFQYGKIRTVAVHPRDSTTLYIGARWHGNLRSTDGGVSWHKINNGVHSEGDDVAAANCFVFDLKNPDHLVMSTGWVDLYQSLNGGERWEHVGDQLADLSICALAAREKSSTMWAVSETDGVFVSHDDCASWHPHNEGLGQAKIKSLHVTRSTNAEVFVGTLGKGIYIYAGD
ncbi:hypothetical protein EH223_14665 [candidate division KSB1 bacterium]|nr:hypothetical protein [candidate division KSB1 bacterium]RQW01558.1 MAG: hypothetical protein EH223_14665 [candidate division KSB1 bacterium]